MGGIAKPGGRDPDRGFVLAVGNRDGTSHLDTVRVQQTISRLRRVLSPEKCATIADWPTTAKESAESILERLYGIRYKAPCDARHTSFGPDGFDLFLSHNVMEHVPPHDLAAIHRESLRILKPGAVAVHLIDLQDHWAYATLRRSVHGFLGNGPISWKLLNPPIHYQNRLRSKEHVLLARTAGFEVMEAIETPASGFAGIGTLEELGVTALRLILRKPSP
jgi:SAM-dependent methyltransferase